VSGNLVRAYHVILTARNMIGVFKCYYASCVYHYFIVYAALFFLRFVLLSLVLAMLKR